MIFSKAIKNYENILKSKGFIGTINEKPYRIKAKKKERFISTVPFYGSIINVGVRELASTFFV